MNNSNFNNNNNNNNDFTRSNGTPVQPWTDDDNDQAFRQFVLAMFPPDLAPSQPAYSQPAKQNSARQYLVAQPQMQETAPIWQQQQQQQMATLPSTMFVQPQQQPVYLPAAPQMAHQPSARPAAAFPQQQQILAWSARVQSAKRLKWTGPQRPTREEILAASDAVPAKDRMSGGLGTRTRLGRDEQIIRRRQQKAMSQINRRAAKKAARSA
ncbi:hypothetical protein LTR97_004446 [Elasticomyces elasticus]|uniref:Uncharacterized protein n=1 Tax=Elasticomyces elasticus TaxID=574655 RepID=A0AAN7VTK5_9PEZI|nr:hypothetical protein LTR97_004446 [Elasticomyces elasticus]